MPSRVANVGRIHASMQYYCLILAKRIVVAPNLAVRVNRCCACVPPVQDHCGRATCARESWKVEPAMGHRDHSESRAGLQFLTRCRLWVTQIFVAQLWLQHSWAPAPSHYAQFKREKIEIGHFAQLADTQNSSSLRLVSNFKIRPA